MRVNTYIRLFNGEVEVEPIKQTKEYFGIVTWCETDGSIATDKNFWDIQPVGEVDKKEAIKRYGEYQKNMIAFQQTV